MAVRPQPSTPADGGALATLRQAPATLPAFLAVVLFVVWAASQAGYPVTHWAPGGLILLVLLAMTAWIVGLRPRELAWPLRVALGCLAAYTALSFLSILWAGTPGDAWEGADRTLLYLLVFVLFAGWRQRAASAAALLTVWTLALTVLAAYAALHVSAAGVAGLEVLLPGGRLGYPSGYPNANAAQWLMAFWAALLLARSERLPWALRGLLAGSAVLLAQVALLSQSRGSLYATPVMLVLVFALLPERTRTFALLVPIAAGIGLSAPSVLHVGDHLENGHVVPATLHTAVLAMFVAAALVGVVVAIGSAVESRQVLPASIRGRVRPAIAAVAVLSLLVLVAGGLAVAGNPVKRIENGWHSFKGGYGTQTGSRLVSGLGSNRYDFYRVALDEFLAHPIVGIGADNFQVQYLLHGHSEETPHYPHSVELRTLTQTGLIGALLAAAGLGAALLACARVLRRADPLARYVVAAALGGFAYWLVHGSIDWFWEFAGLGAPAFALLGLACSLDPASRPVVPALATDEPAGRTAAAALRATVLRRRLSLGAAAVLAVCAALSLGAPWLSQLQIESAARIWTKAPQAAYSRLRSAARLNPLSDRADVVAGGIALRYDDLPRAEHDFSLALSRAPEDAYATLERGAIASARGRRAAALALLERAARLNPREPLARQVLAVVKRGQRVNVEALNDSILAKGEQFR
ncbi:MAG: O-antigen ligase family protein [Solirubrobacteraceae bacterium]